MVQLRKAGQARRPEDPHLRRMLATHMHCGEEMQVVGHPSAGVPDGTDDGGMLTYRCACGFCFDQRRA
jgi:hypothetical protein